VGAGAAKVVRQKWRLLKATMDERAELLAGKYRVERVPDGATLPNGAPYMVMEYLDGGDLAAWLKQRGALAI
jgi:hypothetical protein